MVIKCDIFIWFYLSGRGCYGRMLFIQGDCPKSAGKVQEVAIGGTHSKLL